VPTDSIHLLTQGIQILEDWAHGVTFDSLEVEKERGVVIEEWRLGQGAGERMFKKQLPVIFRGSRYAERLPIGTKTSLETFDPAALRRFYHDWYRPDLMAVIAVGDFDVDQMVTLIQEHLGRVPTHPNPRPRPEYGVPTRDSAAVAIATDPEATSTTLGLYLMRPGRPDPTVATYRRSLVERLYARILNDRLFELSQRPDPPFIGAGGGGGSLVRNVEAFSLGAAVTDTGLLKGFTAVLTEVERAERHGFTVAELQRAKQDFLRSYEQAFAEREKTESSQFAEEYVRNFLSDEPSPGIAVEYDLVQRLLPGVSLEETNRAANEWFASPDRVLLVNAPEKSGYQPPTARQLLAVVDQLRRRDVLAEVENLPEGPLVPEPPLPAAITAERVDSSLGLVHWTLANGATVIVKPTDFKDDEVLFSATSPGGSSLAPDSLYLATAFSSQIASLGGVGEYSEVDLEKKLAGKAVSLTPYVGTFEEGLQGSASPKDLETLFELIYLRFMAPRADPDAFRAFKTNVTALLANRSASPEVAFQDTLTVTLAQHHRRARPLTAAVIDSLELDRAIRMYRDRFADASDFTFFFVGAVDTARIRPLIQRYLGNLPSRGRREQARDVGIRPPTGLVERVVRKGIEPKSSTRLVLTGTMQYNRAERFVIGVLAEILEIKLREALREELGGTYSVSVDAAPTRVPRQQYSLSVSFGSDPERVPQLLAAIDAQLDSLRQQGPGTKELEKVRETIIRTRETQLRENRYWLARLADAERNGEDPHQILDPSDLLALLTRERLRQAATIYLDRRNLVRVTLLPAPPATP